MLKIIKKKIIITYELQSKILWACSFCNIKSEDERHYYLHDKEASYDEEEVEHTDEKINKFFRKITLCKFKQMAKARMFNRNGSFDEELVKEVIGEKLKNVRFVGEEYNFMEKSEIASYVLEEMMGKTILEVKRNYNPKSEIMFNCEFEKNWQQRIGEDQFSIDKAFSGMFEKKTQMSIIEFSDYITKLAFEFNIPQDELKELCEKHVFKCFEDETKVEQVYGLITNNIPRNGAVFDLLSKQATSTEP